MSAVGGLAPARSSCVNRSTRPCWLRRSAHPASKRMSLTEISTWTDGDTSGHRTSFRSPSSPARPSTACSRSSVLHSSHREPGVHMTPLLQRARYQPKCNAWPQLRPGVANGCIPAPSRPPATTQREGLVRRIRDRQRAIPAWPPTQQAHGAAIPGATSRRAASVRAWYFRP